jgi:hypothetical protein
MKGDRQLRKLMFSISTLEELGEVFAATSHLRENLHTALLSIMGMLPVSHGAIFLHRAREGRLVLETGRGVRTDVGIEIPLGANVARTLVRQRAPITITAPPAGLGAYLRRHAAVFDALRARILVPLAHKEQLVGLITLGEKYTGEEFLVGDRELVTVMANYVAIGIHNQDLLHRLETSNTDLRRKVAENRRLYRNLETIYADTVRALGAAIDAKDPYTRGHSDRVARISVAIARTLRLPENEISALKIAGHLHDIGKIAIDNSVLLKPGHLDEGERQQINRHPTVSYDILSNINFPYPDVARIARHHHEWVNGKGYPDRLGPGELLMGMKIISLADAFDAMTSDRPYRPALQLPEVVTRISSGISVQFDPHVTRALFRLVRDEVRGAAGGRVVLDHLGGKPVSARVVGQIDEILLDLAGSPAGVSPT